jgi:hypothetical protein
LTSVVYLTDNSLVVFCVFTRNILKEILLFHSCYFSTDSSSLIYLIIIYDSGNYSGTAMATSIINKKLSFRTSFCFANIRVITIWLFLNIPGEIFNSFFEKDVNNIICLHCSCNYCFVGDWYLLSRARSSIGSLKAPRNLWLWLSCWFQKIKWICDNHRN